MADIQTPHANMQKFSDNEVKFGFYVVGKKGYVVLQKFVEQQGPDCIAFVKCGRDEGVQNDWYDEIRLLAKDNNIVFFSKDKATPCSCPNADYRFAVGWKWMIPDTFKLIVFHDSLLPKYRGFAPLVNMLIDGRRQLGVTALEATESYDEGPIVAQESISVSYPKKIATAIDELIPLYAKLVLVIAQKLLSSRALDPIMQCQENASYSLWRDDGDYYIEWHKDSNDIQRFIDAVGYPYRGAASVVDNQVIRIFSAETMSDVSIENRSAHAGKIIFMNDGKPIVVCGRGLLKLTDLRDENGAVLVDRISFRTQFKAQYEK